MCICQRTHQQPVLRANALIPTSSLPSIEANGYKHALSVKGPLTLLVLVFFLEVPWNQILTNPVDMIRSFYSCPSNDHWSKSMGLPKHNEGDTNREPKENTNKKQDA